MKKQIANSAQKIPSFRNNNRQKLESKFLVFPIFSKIRLNHSTPPIAYHILMCNSSIPFYQFHSWIIQEYITNPHTTYQCANQAYHSQYQIHHQSKTHSSQVLITHTFYFSFKFTHKQLKESKGDFLPLSYDHAFIIILLPPLTSVVDLR